MTFENVREVKKWLSECVNQLNQSDLDVALAAYNDLLLRKMETNENGEFHLTLKLSHEHPLTENGYLHGKLEGEFLLPIAKGKNRTYYVYGDGTFFYENGRLSKTNVKNLSVLSTNGPLSIETLTATLKGATSVKVFEIESVNSLAPYYGKALMAQVGIEPELTFKNELKEGAYVKETNVKRLRR